MISRRIAAVALTSGTFLLAGCAAGRWIVGAPSSGATTRADALLVRRCGGCHEVPEPSEMSAASWHKALTRMRKRITLPQAEWDSLAAMPTSPS